MTVARPWPDRGQYVARKEIAMVKNANSKSVSQQVNGLRKQFHAFLVEPLQGFTPDDWRTQPCSYKIVSYEGPLNYRGRADAWLFMQNKFAIDCGTTDRWAICVN